MFSYDAYKMVDLAPIFEVAPSEGYRVMVFTLCLTV